MVNTFLRYMKNLLLGFHERYSHRCACLGGQSVLNFAVDDYFMLWINDFERCSHGNYPRRWDLPFVHLISVPAVTSIILSSFFEKKSLLFCGGSAWTRYSRPIAGRKGTTKFINRATRLSYGVSRFGHYLYTSHPLHIH